MKSIVKLDQDRVRDLFKGLRVIEVVEPRKDVVRLCHRLLEDPKGQCYYFSLKRGEGYTQHTWVHDQRTRENFYRMYRMLGERYRVTRFAFGEFEERCRAMTAGDVWGTILQWQLKEVLPQMTRTQDWVMEQIYRMVFSEWEWIKKLEGWPACNRATWMAIAKLWQEFDQKYAPECMPGGAWMNSGFSHAGECKDWEVVRCSFLTHDGVRVDEAGMGFTGVLQ